MLKKKLIELLKKLPHGTNVIVRGGLATRDDAWEPAITVWQHNNKHNLTAVIEAAKSPHLEHYNYPEHYSGVQDVTDQYITEKD